MTETTAITDIIAVAMDIRNCQSNGFTIFMDVPSF